MKLSDKEKLVQSLQYFDDTDRFEDIVYTYISRNIKDFPAYRRVDFIKKLTEKLIYDSFEDYENVIEISKEKALYLKIYLEGDMYTTKETAIEAIPIQIKNAQRIIDVCDGKDQ